MTKTEVHSLGWSKQLTPVLLFVLFFLKEKLAILKLFEWYISRKPSVLRNYSRSSGRIMTRRKVEWWVSQYLIILLITAEIISVRAAQKRWTLKSHRSSRVWLQAFIDGVGKNEELERHNAAFFLPLPHRCLCRENSHRERERYETIEIPFTFDYYSFLLNAIFCLPN